MMKLIKENCPSSRETSVAEQSVVKRRGSLVYPFLAAALTFAACDQDHEPIVPDTPDTPTAEYHLRFSGSVGNDNATTRATWTDNNDGKLIFAWDYQESNATTSDLKMAFINDGGDCLMNSESSSVTQARVLRHTDPAKADDKHWAEFETIEGFDSQWTDDNFDGYRVYAVTPINDVNNSQVNVKVEDNIGEFYAELQMPTTFTQSAKNNLAHLSDYMYMYATDVLEGRTASLHFAHLASYIRFKVYNWRGVPATLYGVKLEVVDAGGNAVPASGSKANYTYDGFVYTPATDGNGIQVNLADDDLTFEDHVLLYAPVFPVGSENPFQNSTLRFTLIAQDPTGVAVQGEYKYFTYELSGEVFKEKTGSYDWQTGDLYTFHLYLDDVLTVGKVTVNDWDEEEVDGGVAEYIEKPKITGITLLELEGYDSWGTCKIDEENKQYIFTIPADNNYGNGYMSFEGVNLEYISNESTDYLYDLCSGSGYIINKNRTPKNFRYYDDDIGTHQIRFSNDGGETWEYTGWSVVVQKGQ